MPDLIVHEIKNSKIDLTFEGRRAMLDIGSLHSRRLQEAADEESRRAEEAAYRSRRLQALVDVALRVEESLVEQKAEKRKQTAVKAAKTRAHNKDPFGFDATLLRARRHDLIKALIDTLTPDMLDGAFSASILTEYLLAEREHLISKLPKDVRERVNDPELPAELQSWIELKIETQNHAAD